MAIIIVTKYDNENSKLIIPMFVKKASFLNILEFSGYPFSDFNLAINDKDFEAFDIEEIFRLIIKKKLLNKKIDLINLTNQPEQVNQNKNLLFYLNSFVKTKITQSYKIDTNKYNKNNILDQKKSFGYESKQDFYHLTDLDIFKKLKDL